MEGFEAGPPAEADEAAVVAAAPPKTKTEKLLGIFSLSLAIVLFALDGTMVSVAIPAMVKDLGGEDLLSWIGTAYLLSSTALGPLWGKLGDVLGRKELLLFNICFFILSSVVCALAPSMVVLIIGRGLQGVGGGGMQAGVYVLIADIVTLRERGVYQALMGSIAGVSAILGPLLGGVITDGWSWRGCFWINIPVGVIGFAGVFFALKVPRRAKAPWKVTLARIDYGGAILCVTGSLPPRPDWKVPKEPNVPVHLFAMRNIPFAYLGNFFVGWNSTASSYFLPLFYQLVLGNSPTTSGLKLMPQIGALIPASITAGIISSKTGIYLPFPKVGMAIAAIGIGICALWDASTSLGEQMGFVVILGLGIGLSISMLMLVVQANVHTSELGPATTVATFLRTIGGVVGIGVAGTILQIATGNAITPAAMSAIAANYNISMAMVGSAVKNKVNGHPLPPSGSMSQEALDAVNVLVQDAYVSGLTKAFISIASATAVGWISVMFLRHTVLRTTMDDGKVEEKDGQKAADSSSADSVSTTGEKADEVVKIQDDD
ncbi:major facilitator superfamily domain-containing protein [Hyaloraphidium curvatum]|nr:major facilitator superfamily domain-containing protein [Hyaloraphidium curvatum]